LWFGSGAISASLLTIGVWYWAKSATNEAPLVTYIVVGVVPTLGAALFIRWSGKRQQEFATSVIGGATVFWFLLVSMLVFGTYVLSELISPI
jgi:hypothetical protein